MAQQQLRGSRQQRSGGLNQCALLDTCGSTSSPERGSNDLAAVDSHRRPTAKFTALWERSQPAPARLPPAPVAVYGRSRVCNSLAVYLAAVPGRESEVLSHRTSEYTVYLRQLREQQSLFSACASKIFHTPSHVPVRTTQTGPIFGHFFGFFFLRK